MTEVIQPRRRDRWKDEAWMRRREVQQAIDSPLGFYEVHLGSWRRKPEEEHRWLSYREIADQLVDYVSDLGFTHISLLPISENTFDDTVDVGRHAATPAVLLDLFRIVDDVFPIEHDSFLQSRARVFTHR